MLVPVGAYFIRLARHHRATIFGGLGATVGLLTSLFYKRLMLIKVSSHCGVWVFCMYVCMEIVILSKRTGRFAQNDKIQSIRSCKMFPWCTNHVRVRKKRGKKIAGESYSIQEEDKNTSHGAAETHSRVLLNDVQVTKDAQRPYSSRGSVGCLFVHAFSIERLRSPES